VEEADTIVRELIPIVQRLRDMSRFTTNKFYMKMKGLIIKCNIPKR
jgi:hypothetical protein